MLLEQAAIELEAINQLAQVAAAFCLAKLHPQTLSGQVTAGWSGVLVQLTAKQSISLK